jgi:predicted alpha-1,6-mannanase (GH76 family)
MADRASAVTPTEADAAYNALIKTYWDPTDKFFRKEEKGDEKADFWFAAQLWDTVMDEYERTQRPEVKQLIDDIYDGFIKKYPDWTTNKYNDDILWWSCACARAYKITGNDRYLKKAKSSFDYIYDNFTDDKYGGGVYWLNERDSKHSCSNGPAIIAAVRLSTLLKEPAYLEKAKKLYDWQKETLTDGAGKVFDNIHDDEKTKTPRLAKFSLTYNQGTFLGAAILLYQETKDESYLKDAIKTANWTKINLCTTDRRILKDEGQGDGGAFKGIFIRYMKLLVRDGHREEFLPWMKANADEAWKNRRSDNLMGSDWTAPAPKKINSQTAASAAAALLNFCDEEAKK